MTGAFTRVRSGYAALLAGLAVLPVAAAVEWKSAETTQTQAVLRWKTSDPASCAVEVSKSPTFAPLVNDLDISLFPGANSAARFKDLAKGNDAVFIVGQQAYGVAQSGQLYSRALEWNAEHHYRIKCSDGTLTGTFKTAVPPMGATRGMSLTPHPTEAGRPAWPTIDWQDRSKIYVDPATGAPIRRLTGPDTLDRKELKFERVGAAGPWNNAANVITRDKASATVAGRTDSMFIKWNYKESSLGSPSYQIQGNVMDYFTATVRGNASSGSASAENRTVQLALTVDGHAPATPWHDCVLNQPATTCQIGSGKTMDMWQAPGNAPLGRQDFARRTAAVTVAGNKVTWNGNNASDPNFFSERWTHGTPISLNGTDCIIDSVEDHKHLTLTESCGASGPYAVEGFGILLRKKTASQDTLSVESVEAGYGVSTSYGWSPAGVLPCNSTLVTSVTPNGYVCWISSSTWVHDMYFAPKDGSEWRYIGRVTQGLGAENGATGCFVGAPGKDTRDPTHIYCSYTAIGSTDVEIVRGTYVGDFTPAVASNEFPSGLYSDYQGYPYIPTCEKSRRKKNCFHWESLTPTPKDAISLMRQAYPKWDDVFPKGTTPQCQGASGYYGLSGVEWNAKTKTMQALVICQLGIQNSAQLWFVLDLGNELATRNSQSTIKVIAARDTWSNPDQRWSGGHGVGPLGDGAAGVVYAALNPLNTNFQQSPIDGYGPYTTTTSAPVTAAVGACGALGSSPLLPAAAAPPASGCTTIKVMGEPCDDSPGTAESIAYRSHTAEHNAQCGRPNAYFRQTAQPGDYFTWPDAPRPREVMRLIDKGADGKTWTFARGYYAAVVEGYDETFPVKPRDHAGTTLAVYHNATDFRQKFRGGSVLWDYVNNKVQVDRGTSDSHGWQSNPVEGGGWSFNYYAYSGACAKDVLACYAGKTGAVLERAQKAAFDFSINAAPGFHNLPGGAIANAVDSHPAGGAEFFVDGRAVNGGLSPAFTPVTGTHSIYRTTNSAFAGPQSTNSVVPKLHNIVGFVGPHPLRDISGPTSRLEDTAADQYKMCFALRAGECRVGSTAGDIFVNAPSASPQAAALVCCGGDRGDVRDIAIFRDWSLLDAYTQTLVGKDDPDGRNTRVLTYGLNTWSRHDTFMPPGLSADGKTLLFRAAWVWNYRSDVYSVAIPPIEAENNVRRNAYMPFTVKETLPAGATRMRVKFGYNPQFYCMNRAEECYAVQEAISPGLNPFLFANELSGREGAAAIAVPVLSNKVVYWAAEFLDANGKVVGTHGPEVAAVR